MQQDYIELAREVDGRRGGAQALPVAIAVFIPILTRCVLGAMTGVAVQELYYAAARRENFKVEDLIDGAVTGCIGAQLPPFFAAAANRIKQPLVAAIAAVIIWMSSRL